MNSINLKASVLVSAFTSIACAGLITNPGFESGFNDWVRTDDGHD